MSVNKSSASPGRVPVPPPSAPKPSAEASAAKPSGGAAPAASAAPASKPASPSLPADVSVAKTPLNQFRPATPPSAPAATGVSGHAQSETVKDPNARKMAAAAMKGVQSKDGSAFAGVKGSIEASASKGLGSVEGQVKGDFLLGAGVQKTAELHTKLGDVKNEFSAKAGIWGELAGQYKLSFMEGVNIEGGAKLQAGVAAKNELSFASKHMRIGQQEVRLDFKLNLEAMAGALAKIEGKVSSGYTMEALETKLKDMKISVDTSASPPKPVVEVAGKVFAGASAGAMIGVEVKWMNPPTQTKLEQLQGHGDHLRGLVRANNAQITKLEGPHNDKQLQALGNEAIQGKQAQIKSTEGSLKQIEGQLKGTVAEYGKLHAMRGNPEQVAKFGGTFLLEKRLEGLGNLRTKLEAQGAELGTTLATQKKELGELQTKGSTPDGLKQLGAQHAKDQTAALKGANEKINLALMENAQNIQQAQKEEAADRAKSPQQKEGERKIQQQNIDKKWGEIDTIKNMIGGVKKEIERNNAPDSPLKGAAWKAKDTELKAQLSTLEGNMGKARAELKELLPGEGISLASFGAKAEAWAGAGAKFEAKLGFDDNQLKFKFEAGAAVGVGFSFGLEGGFNPSALGAFGTALAFDAGAKISSAATSAKDGIKELLHIDTKQLRPEQIQSIVQQTQAAFGAATAVVV